MAEHTKGPCEAPHGYDWQTAEERARTVALCMRMTKLEQDYTDAVAALKAIHDVMYVRQGVDWNCRICGGYNYTKETVAHGMTCPLGKVQAALAAARQPEEE